VTPSWFFLSTLNYDARSTTHQIYKNGTLYMLGNLARNKVYVAFLSILHYAIPKLPTPRVTVHVVTHPMMCKQKVQHR